MRSPEQRWDQLAKPLVGKPDMRPFLRRWRLFPGDGQTVKRSNLKLSEGGQWIASVVFGQRDVKLT